MAVTPHAGGRTWSRVVSALLAAQALAACTVERRNGGGEEGGAATAAPSVRDVIRPEGLAGLPVFSPAVRAGDLIFLSGAIGTRPGELALVEGGVGPETRQTMENIKTVLDAAGATLDDVVKCTVFLADIADYDAMNEVYLEYFPADPPARSAVAGSGLALGARVEIECVAAPPSGR